MAQIASVFPALPSLNNARTLARATADSGTVKRTSAGRGRLTIFCNILAT